MINTGVVIFVLCVHQCVVDIDMTCMLYSVLNFFWECVRLSLGEDLEQITAVEILHTKCTFCCSYNVYVSVCVCVVIP